MMTDRASIFSEDFDVSGFGPKQEAETEPATPAAVREVSEKSAFRSREPAAPVAKPTRHKREPRRYRTGRNIQLNVKVRGEALEEFYRIAEAQKWVLGETFENAIVALQRELAGQKKRKSERSDPTDARAV